MSKIILLGAGDEFSNKINKWTFIFGGFLFFAQSVLYIYSSTHGLTKNFSTSFTFLAGIYLILFLILFALIAFSKSSKYALKVKVDDAIIEFKTNFFKKPTKLNWHDIKFIEFKSYQINFHLGNSDKNISYDTSAPVSIEIKETLREIAERKTKL